MGQNPRNGGFFGIDFLCLLALSGGKQGMTPFGHKGN